MSRRQGGGNAKARLQKQLAIQRDLENELQQLNSGTQDTESAKEIIKCVQQNAADPMTSEDNPFWNGHSGHNSTREENKSDSQPSSVYSPITPQALYIDKRRNRRQDSMAMLELKLLDRAPRESLFELGILIMSPAPSPPPLSVIKATQKSKPDAIEMKSIFDSGNGSNTIT